MAGDYIIATYTAAAVSASLAVVSTFPALTGAGAPESRNSEQVRFVTNERAYCEAHERGVDCRCFAKKSGYMQEHDFERGYGVYARDRQDIARGQARRSCRSGV